jgi:hypothetical protein
MYDGICCAYRGNPPVVWNVKPKRLTNIFATENGAVYVRWTFHVKLVEFTTENNHVSFASKPVDLDTNAKLVTIIVVNVDVTEQSGITHTGTSTSC